MCALVFVSSALRLLPALVWGAVQGIPGAGEAQVSAWQCWRVQRRGKTDVSCAVSEEIQNSSKWYDMRKEHVFERPEGTECFVTVSWFVKIHCYVEDVW